MIMAVATPDETEARIQSEMAQKRDNAKASYEQAPVIDELAKFVRKKWQIAKQNRHIINERLLDCLRRRNGEYSATKLNAIKSTGGSEIFMQLTGSKCRSAKAWITDLYSGDRLFTLRPTTVPDLPPTLKQKLISEAVQGAMELGVPNEALGQLLEKHKFRLLDELMQEAEKRADRMAAEIEDLMIESKWRETFDEYIDDLVTYPTAIMKGLEFHRVKQLKWVDKQGQFVPEMGFKIIPAPRRVSPHRFYPSPNVGNKLEGHWGIEHHSFTPADLAAMRGSVGYNAEAIAQALNHYSLGGLREWIWSEEERNRLEGKGGFINRSEHSIDALEFSGDVQGQVLIDQGMSPKEVPDPYESYPISIMVIGEYVVRALLNPDPAGKADYQSSSWQTVPDGFWGKALPELLADTQDTCNAAARALVNNMGMASGPMVWVEMDRLAVGADATSIYPWKVWQSSHKGSGSGAGVGFFQPNSNANELMGIYERFSRYGDDIVGLPAYAQGSDAGAGAARTASGLSMLMNAASKSVKLVVRDIDLHVIEPIVEKYYNYLMLNSDKEDIKGDAVPRARGSESLIHKEQAQMRQQELLGMTANPIDMQIMGLEGRRELLHSVMETGDIPAERIVPSREKLMERLNADAAAIQQQEADGAQPQPTA